MIPYGRQHISDEDIQAVVDVLKSELLTQGPVIPEFEQALNSLEPGTVSEPVRTQFGYHLIEVLDRRDSDVSDERQKAVARQAILQQKLEFRFEEWVRQVRDTTFIKYVN